MSKAIKLIIISLCACSVLVSCSSGSSNKSQGKSSKAKVEKVQDKNTEENENESEETEKGNEKNSEKATSSSSSDKLDPSAFKEVATKMIEKEYEKDNEYNDSRIKHSSEYFAIVDSLKKIAEKEKFQGDNSDDGTKVLTGKDGKTKQIRYRNSQEYNAEKNYISILDSTLQFNDEDNRLSSLLELTFKFNDIGDKGEVKLNDNVRNIVKEFVPQLDIDDLENKMNEEFHKRKKEDYSLVRMEKDIKNIKVNFRGYYSEKHKKSEYGFSITKIMDY